MPNRTLGREQGLHVLLGFSQGASTALRWAALGEGGAGSWDGLIAHSGVIPPDLKALDGDLSDGPALDVVVGTDDPYIQDPASRFRTAEEAWAEAGGIPTGSGSTRSWASTTWMPPPSTGCSTPSADPELPGLATRLAAIVYFRTMIRFTRIALGLSAVAFTALMMTACAEGGESTNNPNPTEETASDVVFRRIPRWRRQGDGVHCRSGDLPEAAKADGVEGQSVRRSRFPRLEP